MFTIESTLPRRARTKSSLSLALTKATSTTISQHALPNMPKATAGTFRKKRGHYIVLIPSRHLDRMR